VERCVSWLRPPHALRGWSWSPQVELWVLRSGDLSGGQQLAGGALIALMAVTLAFGSRAPVPAYFVNGIAVVVTSAVVGVPGDVYPFGNVVHHGPVGDRLGRRSPTLARRTQMAVEHELDLSLAVAVAQEARLVLEAQRRRMAREIHDLVGHTLNVMIVHAGVGLRGMAERVAGHGGSLAPCDRALLTPAPSRCDSHLGRAAHGPRARRPVGDGAWAVEQRDRRRALHRGEHRQDPRRQGVREAGRPRPCTGGRDGVHAGQVE
jgi:glucose-6-phosphate-specific signal transduction histidine kinase